MFTSGKTKVKILIPYYLVCNTQPVIMKSKAIVKAIVSYFNDLIIMFYRNKIISIIVKIQVAVILIEY